MFNKKLCKTITPKCDNYKMEIDIQTKNEQLSKHKKHINRTLTFGDSVVFSYSDDHAETIWHANISYVYDKICDI